MENLTPSSSPTFAKAPARQARFRCATTRQAPPAPLSLVLTFKPLTINDVDLCRNLLTFVLTFKPLVINDVDLVDLYTRICPLQQFRILRPLDKMQQISIAIGEE